MRVLLGDCAVYAQGTDAAITWPIPASTLRDPPSTPHTSTRRYYETSSAVTLLIKYRFLTVCLWRDGVCECVCVCVCVCEVRLSVCVCVCRVIPWRDATSLLLRWIRQKRIVGLAKTFHIQLVNRRSYRLLHAISAHLCCNFTCNENIILDYDFIVSFFYYPYYWHKRKQFY